MTAPDTAGSSSAPHSAAQQAPSWMVLIVAFLSVAIYLPSLDNDFVYDDVLLVLKDKRVAEPGHLGEIWSSDYWPGSRPSYNYRPVTTTSFAIVHQWFGPRFQRFVNLILHAGCSVLVLLLSLSLGLRRWGAFVAALLFALHPLHSEALYLVVGRSELLAGLFGLSFLLCACRGWSSVWLVISFGAAVLSKEAAVTLPVLALLLLRSGSPGRPLRALLRRAARVVVCSIPGLVLVFALRHQLFGLFLAPAGHVESLYNPLVELQLAPRLLNALWVLVLYLKAMVWPVHLSADYSCCQLSLIDSLWRVESLLVLMLLLAPAALVASPRWRWRPETAGLLFVLIALLPVSNVLFPAGVIFGERLAYLPLLGLCLAVGALYGRLRTWWQARERLPLWLSLAPVVLVATLFGIRVVQRDRAWQDDAAFTANLVRTAPKSAHGHRLRATFLKLEGRLAGAERHLRRALRLHPAYHDAWGDLGDLLAEQGRRAPAITAYLRAARCVARRPKDAHEAGPRLVQAARLQLDLGECLAARKSIRRASRFVKGEPPELATLRRRLASCGQAR